MRLKSFYAKTMTEAMQMVRDTLGEDAIIVATREEQGGKAVSVTAAIEPAFEIGPASDDPHAEGAGWLQYDDEDEESAVAEEITESMLRHGVPEDVLDSIISCATVIGFEQPGQALLAAIEHLFQFRPLPTRRCAKALMMVGAPGAGKTLAVAKMAARGMMDGLKIGVISTDTVRAGGVEQLQAFTDLMKIELKKAKTPEELHRAIEEFKSHDQILIDTAGMNPFDPQDVKTLARLIGADDIDPILVMPAGGDAEESAEIARIFATIGVHSIVPTRIDIARRLGGVLAAAHQAKLAFADAGNSPKVAGGLTNVTPETLSKWLMPTSYREKARSPFKQTGTRQ